ncbi:Dihydrolipoyllysine-residue acetyltransferase component of pyruvate dehydrogenase complex [Chromobacterium violaceum]|uniref:Dihydrolipoyllysine-residue acetyltransferase component of pyruvate dehydrogenase complex n=1 Tax=Chromobacterium violaceum TaxID=536 RepID=A0AAX2MEN8_CHRVL|nr:Dihydrolipoyllysine-residue acetyltransferase component of pyruvate dehydrogenase complex [Chromobacterium violaceum]
MSNLIELKVPDIGGHSNVDIIEVFIAPGQTVSVDDSLITLETDKATMEVPAEAAGVIKEVKAVVGGKISEGDVIAILEVGAAASAPARRQPRRRPQPLRPLPRLRWPPLLLPRPPRRRRPAAAKSACRTSAAITAST